jgi:hypothetical protein
VQPLVFAGLSKSPFLLERKFCFSCMLYTLLLNDFMALLLTVCVLYSMGICTRVLLINSEV